MKQVYAVLFKGAGLDAVHTVGDDVTSAGMLQLADALRAAGIIVAVRSFDEESAAIAGLQRALNIGEETAAIGSSAGAGTAMAISRVVKLGCVCAIDPSRDCINYRLYRPNVARSILFHNNYWFSRLVVDLDQHVHQIIKQELLRLTA